jgi:hypothetical protein
MVDSKHQKTNTNKGSLGPSGLPDAILSLHVDHGLQSDAETMARAASAAATTFKADHSELRIPWGEPPFPPRPGNKGEGGDAIESLARTARYRLIFDAMVRCRSRNHHHRHSNDDADDDADSMRVLATGHHADDQVETVLMRLGAGSSALGLGGMRSVRRFGMSLGRRERDFGWFGHEGLHRWIVRPLLDVSKVSLRACATHPTPPHPTFCFSSWRMTSFAIARARANFPRTESSRLATYMVFAMCSTTRISSQTSRYATPFATCSLATKRIATLPKSSFVPPIVVLYDCMKSTSDTENLSSIKEPVTLPPVLADKIARVKSASENLQTPIDLMASREDLHAAVRSASRDLSDIESRGNVPFGTLMSQNGSEHTSLSSRCLS